MLRREKCLCEIKFAEDINRCCVHLSLEAADWIQNFLSTSCGHPAGGVKLADMSTLTKHVTSCPLQGSVFLGYESVSVTHVHLFLVLRHGRHGHRHLYLQIHRVLWVSNHHDSIGLKIVLQQPTSNYSAGGYCFSWMRVTDMACFNLPYMLLRINLYHRASRINVSQSWEGVGWWDTWHLSERCTLRSHEAGGGTATHQELEVSPHVFNF